MSQKFKNPIEVEGYVLSNDGALSGEYRIGTPGTKIAGNALMAYMQFYTGGTEKMRVDINGNVGIGTSSPNFKLGIQASEPTFGILQAISNNNGGNATLGAKILFDVSGIGNFWEGMPSGANAWAVGLYNGSTNPEYMRITSSGNVGIGTTTPGAKLEVAGASRFTGAGGRSVVIEGNGAGRIDINGDGSAYATGILFNSQLGGTALSGIWNYGSGTSQQWLALGGTAYNNSSMYILPSGNVGIGTTSPSYRTQIETTGADVFLTKNTSSTSFNRSYFYNNNNVGIQFLNFGSAYGFGTEFGVGQNGSVIQSNTTSAFAVGTSGAYPLLLGTSGTERMRITSAGNVGIGTTTPSVKLVADGGSSSFTPIWAKSSFLASSKYYASLYAGYALATNQLTQFGYVYDTITPANSFAHITPYGSTEGSKFMVRADGNVGIGTSNPEVSLDVVGISGGTAQGRVRSTSGGDIRISVDTVGRLGTYSASSLLLLTSGTERMRIDTSGNVGIGTSSPSGKLDVREVNRVFDGYGNINVFTTNTGTQNVGGSIALGGDSFGGTTPYPFAKIQGIKEGGGAWSGSLILGTTQSNSAITEKMRITSAGNVGIGTSSPSTKLQVNGDISSVMTGPAGNTGMYKFGDGSTFVLGGTTSPFISFELGYSEKMRIEGSTDNVGIGTSTPNSSAKLDISSTKQGFLPPRMNDTEMNSISSPVDGLMVFNTDVNTICVYISSAGGWKRLLYV